MVMQPEICSVVLKLTQCFPSNYYCLQFLWDKQAKNLPVIQLLYNLMSFGIRMLTLYTKSKILVSFAEPESQTTFIHGVPVSPYCSSLGKSDTNTFSWDPTGLGFGKGQGCRAWKLCVCLLSQYCILFRLPLGGTVSKKTRKETGWKQRKRKGTQCDGACPSLILVQPESCGQWRHRCN